MNRLTYFLLTVSILGAANLSCRGPDSAALDPMIAGDCDRSGSAQSSLDTGISRAEIETTVSESNRDRQSRVDKIREEKELMMLAGLAASLL